MRAVLVLLMFALVTPAFAQPAPDRREKIKQKVRALRAYTLTEQLDLDEATAGKLFPALAKYDDEFDKLLAARADIQRRLESASSIKDPKEVDKLVDEAVANQKALWTTEDQRLAQLRKILTPGQVARVLIVLPAMERKIQNQLRRAAQKPAGRPVDPYGELGGNPFDKSQGEAIDPFGPRPGAGPKRQPAKKKAGKPCDPFSDVHGCGAD